MERLPIKQEQYKRPLGPVATGIRVGSTGFFAGTMGAIAGILIAPEIAPDFATVTEPLHITQNVGIPSLYIDSRSIGEAIGGVSIGILGLILSGLWVKNHNENVGKKNKDITERNNSAVRRYYADQYAYYQDRPEITIPGGLGDRLKGLLLPKGRENREQTEIGPQKEEKKE